MRYQPNIFRLILLFSLCTLVMNAQSKKQQELEAKRQSILKEIQQINTLLFTKKKEEKSIISTVEDLNYKVNVRKNLIKITNDQANLLTREINTNQKQISSLRDQLKYLKEDYAAMVVKSYKSKSEQSRVMFLLSSENFKQAYKRLQYIRQYTDYQKEQGEEIKRKTEKLQELNITLLQQKKDKDKLVEENRLAKQKLEDDVKEHQKLMASVRKNMTAYVSQIRTKQQEADRIDREIEKLIREAIAASNKKAGKSETTSKGFALTPEAKALEAKFESNKGKLPWPVRTGVIKVRYGKQRSLIDNSIEINSNGVRIATDKNAKVRAVFNGEVLAVQGTKNGNPWILIQHGNYITVYKNLSRVYVVKGDRVTTNQDIAEVFTDQSSGETMLSFAIYKDSKFQDPSVWIVR
ncbi:septal ring factor EnvC (AmiA/AmiB activator) [Gelidibacter algens]|uniref:Septal ring factor EnvC (AmiA/AmiB activator) n=1 Tax=Gelidibacter algens TaxID=49280 RepID=A0A1A7R006_9FLAO|nr:peptidoglycan DD-metalloendopeptidase family protein [Gelidibacter algens]OBX24819.1 peptidase M23 [Gelidibacter algens]RAJ24401.1 septal ring factor EnvC (AmiA/AmiB activator) [Gelidibacter algens]